MRTSQPSAALQQLRYICHSGSKFAVNTPVPIAPSITAGDHLHSSADSSGGDVNEPSDRTRQVVIRSGSRSVRHSDHQNVDGAV
jgi:hypothetical protein